MLLLIPDGGVDPQRPLERYPGPPTDPMPASRTFEFVKGGKRRFRRATSAMRLSVGRAGVCIDSTSGRRLVAVRWADCVGVVRERGYRSVISRDGTALTIAAVEWRDGGSALREIDRHGPRELVIDTGPAR